MHLRDIFGCWPGPGDESSRRRGLHCLRLRRRSCSLYIVEACGEEALLYHLLTSCVLEQPQTGVTSNGDLSPVHAREDPFQCVNRCQFFGGQLDHLKPLVDLLSEDELAPSGFGVGLSRTLEMKGAVLPLRRSLVVISKLESCHVL